MMWHLSHRGDQYACRIADRHYNRQSIGSSQCAPPGRCMVLTADKALWITSWPFAEWVKHDWAGARMCSSFRNESEAKASKMVRQAVAATRAFFGDPPPLGMVTFVDPDEVRAKANPGHCFIIAGFRPVGFTKGGLLALRLLPAKMPEPQAPLGLQMGFAA